MCIAKVFIHLLKANANPTNYAQFFLPFLVKWFITQYIIHFFFSIKIVLVLAVAFSWNLKLNLNTFHFSMEYSFKWWNKTPTHSEHFAYHSKSITFTLLYVYFCRIENHCKMSVIEENDCQTCQKFNGNTNINNIFRESIRWWTWNYTEISTVSMDGKKSCNQYRLIFYHIFFISFMAPDTAFYCNIFIKIPFSMK